MNEVQNKHFTQVEDDEIDLLEIAVSIWKMRVSIIVLTLLISIPLAILIVFFVHKTYTTNVNVAAPNSQNLGNYFFIEQEYALIKDNKVEDFSELETKLGDSVFSSFWETLGNSDFREDFLAKSETVKEITEKNPEIVNLKSSIFSPLALKSEKEKDKFSISYSSKDPEFSINLLTEILNFANEYNRNKFRQFFELQLENQLIALETTKLQIETNLLESKYLNEKDIKEALLISNNNTSKKIFSVPDSALSLASIDKKYTTAYFLHLMGKNYLTNQLKKLESEDLHITPDLKMLDLKIDKLTKLKTKKIDDFDSYTALTPLPEKVKKSYTFTIALIFVAFVLSFIFSVMFLYLRLKIKESLEKK